MPVWICGKYISAPHKIYTRFSYAFVLSSDLFLVNSYDLSTRIFQDCFRHWDDRIRYHDAFGENQWVPVHSETPSRIKHVHNR